MNNRRSVLKLPGERARIVYGDERAILRHHLEPRASVGGTTFGPNQFVLFDDEFARKQLPANFMLPNYPGGYAICGPVVITADSAGDDEQRERDGFPEEEAEQIVAQLDELSYYEVT
jgi:hypothetical protein